MTRILTIDPGGLFPQRKGQFPTTGVSIIDVDGLGEIMCIKYWQVAENNEKRNTLIFKQIIEENTPTQAGNNLIVVIENFELNPFAAKALMLAPMTVSEHIGVLKAICILSNITYFIQSNRMKGAIKEPRLKLLIKEFVDEDIFKHKNRHAYDSLKHGMFRYMKDYKPK